MKKELHQYLEFVDQVTSPSSKDKEAYINSIEKLYESGCDVARLDTAATGMSSEAGEFGDIVKKLKFQGKLYDENTRKHLMLELSDVCWYLANACIALNVDPYTVLDMNVEKLQSRYPGGTFSIDKSSSREKGDI